MAQHKHFELMALFLEDARVSETPWVFWQRRRVEPNILDWVDCDMPPQWNTDFQYRRKPRTIRIGEFDVPEPMLEGSKNGKEYYIPKVHDFRQPWMISAWENTACDRERLQNGMCHATKEAATLHAIALISLTCTPERLAELKKLL